MPRKPIKQSPLDEDFFDPDSVYTPKPIAPNEKAISSIYAGIDGIEPAAKVLNEVVAVPTRFISFDWATRVGGMPTERFVVVHGPSSHGKTSFCHGIGSSFLQRQHFYWFIDAEYTTPIGWLRGLMGEVSNSPLFVASRPKSFEQTALNTRKFLHNIIEGKKSGKIDPSTRALICVDSIRKLVPESILAKMTAELKKEKLDNGIDGFKGRAGMIKAAMNAAWLDELIPMLAEAGATMIAITRESQNTSTDMFATDWKMTGGNALEFDSSLIIRVERDAWMKNGTGEDAEVIGERHRLTIRKTKVGGKEGKNTLAWFHTSNGVDSPEGFDEASDLLFMAKKFGIVQASGSWLAYGDRKWHGERQLLHALRDDIKLNCELTQCIRLEMAECEPDKGGEL